MTAGICQRVGHIQAKRKVMNGEYVRKVASHTKLARMSSTNVALDVAAVAHRDFVIAIPLRQLPSRQGATDRVRARKFNGYITTSTLALSFSSLS